MTAADALRAGIGRALARLPSGLYVLTAGRGEAATGMLASWVQQVGFEPPALVVALKKGRPVEALVRSERAFCLAVLDEQSRGLMSHFAGGFVPGENAFAGVATATSSIGVPYPAQTLAYLVCRVRGVADDWCDHAVVCGEVVGGDARTGAAPLVHVRKNGFAY
jgi:flavin reductase (DIM6/NTAB) family NADH-FMN oxidoreductase RutF